MVLGLVLGALAVGTGVASYREQKKANKLQQSLADNRAANERRQSIRQARLARGRLLNASAQSGGAGSSSEASALGGIGSQLGFNLAESYATQALSGRISDSLGKASSLSVASNIFSAAGSFANNPNNQGYLDDLFQKNKPKTSAKSSPFQLTSDLFQLY